MGWILDALLAKRGLTGSSLEEYLDPALRRLARFDALPGIMEAAGAILPFVRDRRTIVVFGDYDCDGVCASAILAKTLIRLGANVRQFVPDRFSEGYGLTSASIVRMLAEIPDVALVVTVDCGISSMEEVRLLKSRGIAVVVTDHHLPPETLPECDAVVDMKAAAGCAALDEFGARDICGAGVAFFLANALVARATSLGMYSGEKFGAPLLVLAGLATVVDIVPLVGQNRILAANALRMFRAAPVGLLELLSRAQRRSGTVTSRDFGFLLGPRINAAGRMATARDACDLLMAEDREQARNLAQRVDVHNAERKTVEGRMLSSVEGSLPEAGIAAIVVGCGKGDSIPGWHTGVAGNVASRLVDRYGVPAAVVVNGIGSVRAPGGYNVYDALTGCSDHLLRFGGHVAAGGFAVKPGRFDDFKAAFVAACESQCAAGANVSQGTNGLREPDLWISPGDLTLALHDELQAMAPFGEGNPEPEFGLRGVLFSGIRLIGESGKHASFQFADRRIPRAVWWGHGTLAERLRSRSSERFDITFTLEVSDWGGGDEPHLELRVTSLASA